MNDEQKSKEQLIAELAEMRQQIDRLEVRKRRDHQALRESQQQLQQAQKMEALGTLVAGAAHEINNPLNLIMYNIPLLKKIWIDLLPILIEHKRVEPEQKFGGFAYDFLEDNLVQLVADMELAAHRVAKTVSDLKNFSKQSNVAEKAPMQVNTAVKNAMRLAQSTLRESSVNIHLKLTEDLPCIEGNLQSIEQVILNIIINAVQGIDHQHGKIEITTGFQVKDGRVYINPAKESQIIRVLGGPQNIRVINRNSPFSYSRTKYKFALVHNAAYSLVGAAPQRRNKSFSRMGLGT